MTDVIGENNEKQPKVSPINGQPVPGGRPKGSPNKSTQAVREAIAIFIQKNAMKLDQWAEEIYEKKGAEGALQVFTDLLEYAQPKLARTEVQNLDKEGNPADPTTIEIVLVKNQPEDPRGV